MTDLYISLLDSPNIPTFISGLITKLKKKVGKSDKEDISENFDYKVDAYSFDLVLKNKALEGYFIVKDFRDKVVTLGDLQLCAINKYMVRLLKSLVFRFRKLFYRINPIGIEHYFDNLEKDHDITTDSLKLTITENKL